MKSKITSLHKSTGLAFKNSDANKVHKKDGVTLAHTIFFRLFSAPQPIVDSRLVDIFFISVIK